MNSTLLARPGDRFGRGRLLASLVAPLLVVSLLGATPGPVTSATAADESVSLAAESAPPSGKQVTVTLVTGDRVVVAQTADGEWQMVRTEPAPRPDGTVPGFEAWGMSGEGSYVVPDDVRPYLSSGALDMELFNVGYLADNGYADRDDLPVVVEYAGWVKTAVVRRDAERMPASDQTVTLKTVNASAVTVDKSHADKFWTALARPVPAGQMTMTAQTADLPGPVKKVWLDRVAYVDLDESVPQVGAPQAWDAGYTGEGATVAVLDTGVDTSHPDLVGKVAATKNFTSDADASDSVGHGTHVAATISGSGAASDANRRGVAPDAELLNGKVCVTNGCPFSAIMAGMEWATIEQGADVVNMSLGTPTASNGLDLLSQMVNQLSADTGALFVTSAGNSGPGSPSVGSPGAADAALAVGAVDKADQLAEFSSRGPRLGDRAIKPEITAPGVGIVAARADGTGLGTPVDEQYTSLSGTSMAAPHVAGAAAILAQQHPDWGPDELKAALVRSATTTGQLGGTITSGPFDGTTYTVSSGSGTARIDAAISGTPTFVGHACDALDAGEGIALVERGPASGPCSFQNKLDNIVAAGFEAGIVFNQPGTGCLDEFTMQASGDIPFVSVDRLVGLQLLQQPNVTDDNACTIESPDAGSEVASTTIEPGATGDYTVYEQGAGRLDVARAVSNQVQVSPAAADFRLVPFERQEPLEPRTLTYTNPTSAPVTLDMSVDFRSPDGELVPEGVLALDQESVTVPAGGTATVTATLDHSTLEPGQYSGRITATDETTGTQLTTPVGFVRGHDLHDVTITVETDPDKALFSRQGDCVPPLYCHAFLFAVDVPFVEEGSYIPASITCVQGDSEAFSCTKYELTGIAVPAGTYNLSVGIRWVTNTGTQSRNFDTTAFLQPGIEIHDDTELAFHTDELKPYTPTTHRPSHAVGRSGWLVQQQTESAATAQSGEMSNAGSASASQPATSWLTTTTGSDAGYIPTGWVTPAQQVTVGEFIEGSNWQMVNPLVDLAVTEPQGLDLTSVAYPDHRPIEFGELIRGAGSVRFDGRQSLPVVDVGVGAAADIDGRDLTGKLALMRTGYNPEEQWCSIVRVDPLRNALDAGAAGVLIANPHAEGDCSRRPGALQQGSSRPNTEVDIPWVSISVKESDRIRTLLDKGPVTIRVTDTSDDEYAYFLGFINRNATPDAPAKVTKQDVTEVETHYHRDEPGPSTVHSVTSWKEGARFGGLEHWVTPDHVLAPTVRTEYLAMNAPGGLLQRQVSTGGFPSSYPSWVTVDALTDHTQGRVQHWHHGPIVPGAHTAPYLTEHIEAGVPLEALGDVAFCSGCRVGDVFIPRWDRTSPDPRQRGFLRWYEPGPFRNDTVRMFRDGEEIPLKNMATQPGAPANWPMFELPPENAEYELTLATEDTGVDTRWQFTSEAVTQEARPRGVTNCYFVSGPCRAEPLVYLRYDAGVDLDNTVPAHGSHTMKVTAYHQDPDGPKIGGLRLWTSMNGGEQWRQARIRPLGDGEFEVILSYPPAHRRGSDTVSIKAEAWDVDGNRIEQMIPTAYRLVDQAPDRGSN